MAKKEKVKSKGFSFRLGMLALFSTIVVLGWWFWDPQNDLRDTVSQYIENGEILTIESKYTPEQLMEEHRQDLIGQDKRIYQDPIYKYSPYLLLEVKYVEDKKSREANVLWSLADGEMVLNTESWETTHGFQDCLNCNASRHDFKVIQALARYQEPITIERLQKDLQVERETVEVWLESAKNKHLITQKGPLVQLHFEDPVLLVSPQTIIKQPLVSKPIHYSQRNSKLYTRNQVVRMVQDAFGEDFTIRQEKEVFIPVYTLTVLNPDGSIHTSEWNAVTGQRM